MESPESPREEDQAMNLNQLDNLLTIADLAHEYHVSVRTAQRWATELLDAPKATQEQILALLQANRLKGIPPTGVLVVPRTQLAKLSLLKKPVGYPKGQRRQQKEASS